MSGCVGDGLGGDGGAGVRPATAPAGGCASAVAEPPCCLATDETTGATFSVAPGQPLLEAGIDQGVDLAHGCRNGVCGACAVELTEGAEFAERPDAIEANSLERFHLPRAGRLACRLRVRGPVRFRPV